MGTKNDPGPFDWYAKLEDDEEFFPLMARDPDFEMFVRMWCHWRHRQISYGIRSNTAEEHEQIREALRIADRGSEWGLAYRIKKQNAGIEFDREGYPTSGPHMRKTNQTTSGANET